MTDTVITLIGRKIAGYDDYGQPEYEPTRTEVLCASVPIARSEYFSAMQIGITPDYEFVVNTAEYNGELVVEYNGKKLKVYRTYERSDNETEIYCQLAVGLNGRSSTL